MQQTYVVHRNLQVKYQDILNDSHDVLLLTLVITRESQKASSGSPSNWHEKWPRRSSYIALDRIILLRPGPVIPNVE